MLTCLSETKLDCQRDAMMLTEHYKDATEEVYVRKFAMWAGQLHHLSEAVARSPMFAMSLYCLTSVLLWRPLERLP